MSNDEQQAPLRLRQTLGAAGDCVREVLAEQALVAPLPRFAQVQERRLRRVRQQRGLSLIVLAAATLVGARALHQEEQRPGIRAEPAVGSSKRAQVVASVPAHDELVAREPSAPAPARSEGPTVAAPKSSRASGDALGRPGELEHALDDAQAKQSRPGDDRGTAKACAQLARGGAAEQALGCYQILANGSGMTAELALFEQARLEGKVLRRPERALSTLSEYRRRFPNGSLRGEVMLAQIDWLQAAGDSARALEVVDEALASGLLREREAELLRLRATLRAARD